MITNKENTPEARQTIQSIIKELDIMGEQPQINTTKFVNLPLKLAQEILVNHLLQLLTKHPEQWTINGVIAFHEETNTRLYIEKGYRHLDECVENPYVSRTDYHPLNTVPKKRRKELYNAIKQIRTNKSIQRVENPLNL
jgi:hypothetical protein